MIYRPLLHITIATGRLDSRAWMRSWVKGHTTFHSHADYTNQYDYAVYRTLNVVLHTGYTVQCTPYIVIPYTLWRMPYAERRTTYTVRRTRYATRYVIYRTMNAIRRIVYTIYRTYTVWRTPFTLYRTIYILFNTM